MTTLKEQMQQDVDNAFLNTNEFAESVEIEGVTTSAVCDWNVEPEGEHLSGDTGDTWGMGAVHAEISLAENVIITPEIGQEIAVNDKYWIVRRVRPESGILHLWLYRNVA